MQIDHPQLNITLPNFKRNSDTLMLPTLPEHRIKKKSPPPSITPQNIDIDSDGSLNKKKRRIKRPKFSLADSESLDARRKYYSTSNRKNYFTKNNTNSPPFKRGSEIKIINENDFWVITFNQLSKAIFLSSSSSSADFYSFSFWKSLSSNFLIDHSPFWFTSRGKLNIKPSGTP